MKHRGSRRCEFRPSAEGAQSRSLAKPPSETAGSTLDTWRPKQVEPTHSQKVEEGRRQHVFGLTSNPGGQHTTDSQRQRLPRKHGSTPVLARNGELCRELDKTCYAAPWDVSRCRTACDGRDGVQAHSRALMAQVWPQSTTRARLGSTSTPNVNLHTSLLQIAPENPIIFVMMLECVLARCEEKWEPLGWGFWLNGKNGQAPATQTTSSSKARHKETWNLRSGTWHW